jgi:hypothetical protein
MPHLVIRSEDGRELQISPRNYVFFRDEEGEVNWEWEYLPAEIRSAIQKLVGRADGMLDEVKDLLPDVPMGRIK